MWPRVCAEADHCDEILESDTIPHQHVDVRKAILYKSKADFSWIYDSVVFQLNI